MFARASKKDAAFTIRLAAPWVVRQDHQSCALLYGTNTFAMKGPTALLHFNAAQYLLLNLAAGQASGSLRLWEL